MYIAKNVKCLIERQTRFPRSKKKRIVKKWGKNKKNWGWAELKGVKTFSVPGMLVLPPGVEGETIRVNYECRGRQ